MTNFKDIYQGFDIHMSGPNGIISKFDCVELADGGVAHYVATPLDDSNVIVVGNGDEISVYNHKNNYFTVIYSGIIRTAMFVDGLGTGLHACHITSGQNTVGECLPIDYIEEVEDADVLMASSLEDLSVSEDVKITLKETIRQEYLAMLKLGGYNDDGQEAVDNKIKELELA